MKREMNTRAMIDNLEYVLSFIKECLNSAKMGEKSYIPTLISCEEIFINIIKHAYKRKGGDVHIICKFGQARENFSITFSDDGKEFNPLKKDIQSFKEILSGGIFDSLGIYLIKNLTSNCEYKYENRKNYFTIYQKAEITKDIEIKTKELDDDSLLIKISGRMDTITSPIFEKKLDEIFEDKYRDLKIDLADVNYVSSSGLRALLTVQKTINKIRGNLVIINIPDNVRDLFDMTGFSNIFRLA